MGRKIVDDETWEREFKDYDPTTDERLVLKLNSPSGIIRYVISPGEYILFDKKYVVYYGFVTNPREIGPYCALYKIGGKVFYQDRRLRPIDLKDIEPRKRKEYDNSRLLDVDVKPHDNDLMVISKQLLNGMTLNQFKAMFDNVSTLNNFRREIESSASGNLTWNRFTYLLDLLGCEYNLEVTAPEVKDGKILKPTKEIKVVKKED